MSDKPNDAVTNTADLMINYTDDEIKAEVWSHIRKIVEEVVREEVRVALTDHSVTERIVVNHAYRIEQMAKNALKNAVASINVY